MQALAMMPQRSDVIAALADIYAGSGATPFLHVTDAMLKRTMLHTSGERGAQSGGEPSLDLDEARMRQALEKLSSGGAPSRTGGFPPGQIGAKTARHRYVQDGEVVVEHATGSRGRGFGSGSAQPAVSEPRFTELQAALATERAAREQAERGQERAISSARALETRLKHTEVSLREALDQVGVRETELEAVRADLAAAQAELRAQAEVRAQAEARLQAEARERAAREAEQSEVVPDEMSSDQDEPEPVKWWLTSKSAAKPAAKRAPRRRAQAAIHPVE